MYERSAIVLEKYLEKVLQLNKQYNLRKNNENYSELINEIENYQNVTEKELEVIQEFDDTAKEIEKLQQEQEKLHKANKQLEEERSQLFTELGEEAETLDVKIKKIENLLEKNNEKLKEIRSEFINNLTDFSKKQKNRNKCEKARRIGETNHVNYIERMNAEFEKLDVKDIVCLKDFISFGKEKVKQEVLEIMIRNGKSEKVPFDQDVLKKAIKVRIEIAEREAECYISVYDKMKKLLAEPDSDVIRLNKYQKTLRDTSVKLAFLQAEREYIAGFLDYERMVAISGPKIHKKAMIEACNNFELDIMQIEKLYELIIKEITSKATKKIYNQLYNKTYLKNIEDKEKNFEQEVNNVNISMGTVINSNYWRIEGIKNIYMVFQEEVSQKFNRDLSEFRIEELEKRKKTYHQHKMEDYLLKEDKEEFNDEEDFDDEDEFDYEEDFDDEEEFEYEEDFNDEEEFDYEEDFDDEEDFNDEDEFNYDEEFDDEENLDEVEFDDEKEFNHEEDFEDEEEEDEEEIHKEDEFAKEEDYKKSYRNNYKEDEYDDEYENIYEYNYDDDEEEYRKQKSRNKTVISFDDEESIDMIIANSRKKTNNRRNNNKGLFNKLFKK